MYSNILITHRVVVTVFFVHYLIKLALLLLNRKEQLTAYTRATRIIEMLLSVTFLVTGIWMLVQNNAVFGSLMLVKLLCVFAAIPVAIIGFRKGNKLMATLAVFLIVMAYGFAEMGKKQKAGGKIDTSAANGNEMAAGQMIYEEKCEMCHGNNGALGANGAKDLSITKLSFDEQKTFIKNGKGAMPGYNMLTDAQLEEVVKYVSTLHKQ